MRFLSHIRYFWLLCIISLVLGSFLAFATEVSAAEDIVRIGYILPKTNTISPLQAQQSYIAYFDEIARQTGWNYDAIPVTAENCFDALENRQIDFLVPAEYNPQRLNDGIIYSETDFCYDILGLYTRPDEQRFEKNNPDSLNGASVGLFENRAANSKFEEFCSDNHLSVERHYYANKDSLLNALQNGEIDLFVDTDTNAGSSGSLLMQFAVIPARIAALRSNAQKMESINEALENIHIENPQFEVERQNAFYLPAQRSIAYFTLSEANFIKNIPPLTVVFFGEQKPFLSFDKTSHTAIGIFPDILQLLAEETGLQFKFVYVASFKEALTMLDNGSADLMLHIYTNSETASHFYFTNPIYTEKYAFIGKNRQSLPQKENPHIVLPDTFHTLQPYVQKQLPAFTVDIAPSIDACLKKVNTKQADLAAINISYLQTNADLVFYPELSILPTNSLDVPISLAISKSQPKLLQALLNKAILRLNPQKIDQIVLKHTTNAVPQFTLSYFLSHYPLQLAIAVAFVLLLLLTGIFFFYHNRVNYRQKELLTQKNKLLEDTILALKTSNLDRDNYKYIAEIDPLTQLMNKAAIEAICREALMRPLPPEQQDAFFIIDLDHFKEANDTYGHQYGDEILKKFASALTGLLRQQDAIGRFGGDEFIVFLKNIRDVHILHRIAHQINTAARELDIKDDKPALSASIGIALAPQHGTSYEEIFHAADLALYKVKEHGRDNYQLYQTRNI